LLPSSSLQCLTPHIFFWSLHTIVLYFIEISETSWKLEHWEKSVTVKLGLQESNFGHRGETPSYTNH
jgi:hypothetical protein